jgi:hypothetical protein
MKNALVDSEMMIEYIKKLNNKDQQTIRIHPSGEVYARFKENSLWQHWHRYNDKKQLWERVMG